MTLDTAMECGIIAGSALLMVFCTILARRLRRLNDLEQGLGGAIAVMAAEIDRLEQSIRLARQEAMSAGEVLAAEVQKAQSERARWDLHLRMRDALAAGPAPDAPSGAVTRLRRRRVPLDA
ncbi:hypothetical protein [Paracoccus zhejiangensis]|uniref:Uncharacterized protein n=1 Tax=Paracoccus zhejiangensis TaxID=1077935 RepID=A0A2H5EYY0_9RHOB|nr:hypothetical protein [Paracoccus zhejiangensis]AUH64505.1 hypothetical protein CX676_10295 [Paracoccus zhejiangensis]